MRSSILHTMTPDSDSTSVHASPGGCSVNASRPEQISRPQQFCVLEPESGKLPIDLRPSTTPGDAVVRPGCLVRSRTLVTLAYRHYLGRVGRRHISRRKRASDAHAMVILQVGPSMKWILLLIRVVSGSRYRIRLYHAYDQEVSRRQHKTRAIEPRCSVKSI